MYEMLKKLYDKGHLTDMGLKNAVVKGWITEGQKETIINVKSHP